MMNQTSKKAIDFTFDTPFDKGLKLSQEAAIHKYTFLIFLRYFGCRSCQVDMIDLAEAKSDFEAKDAQVYVVLQSSPEIAAEGSNRFDLPFGIICDPNAELYKLYDVPSAGSKEAMTKRSAEAAPDAVAKMEAKKAKREKLGLEHGAYEGDEYQLPAYFLIDSEMNLLKSHRASSMGDMPTAEEYLEMI
ncbi:MAG: redoxin domain-containing protein [Clostridiaceae bacterium]|nr:redoxin domain-containing protein [Clostridiaceae bacterium]